MIDIVAKGHAYKWRAIVEIGWVQSSENLADGFEKAKRCPSLDAVLK